MSSRRKFIKQNSLALLGSAFAKSFVVNGATRGIMPDPLLRVRKCVNNMDANDPIIVSYKKAVTIMKQRSEANPNDPLGWRFQMNIHENFCPHENWFFLPWHRAYIYYFEQICRDACGDQSFNLPYWDWTANPSIPQTFWGEGNILYDHTRTITPSGQVRNEFVGQHVIDILLLQTPSFEDFGSHRSLKPRGGPGGGLGRLESAPHNGVHACVGGNLGNVLVSPLDPIFWLHHANIDRLWATWNDRGYTNPADLGSYVFNNNFCNTTGQLFNVQAQTLFDVRKLGYRYESQSETNLTAHPINSAFALQTYSADYLQQTVLEKSKPSALIIKAAHTLTTILKDIAQSSAADKLIRLFIIGVQKPEKEDFIVRVFINAPKNSTLQPNFDDPHYVASFAFFTSNHKHPGMQGMDDNGMTFVFDITQNVRKITKASKIKIKLDELVVTLVTVPETPDSKAELSIKKLSITVAKRQ